MSWQDDAQDAYYELEQKRLAAKREQEQQNRERIQKKKLKDAGVIERITGIKFSDSEIDREEFVRDGWRFDASERPFFRDDDGIQHNEDVVIMRPESPSARYKVYTVSSKAEIGEALKDHERIARLGT